MKNEERAGFEDWFEREAHDSWEVSKSACLAAWQAGAAWQRAQSAPAGERDSYWFSLLMNCAAELETASYCMTDTEAKRVAQSGADYYRDQARAAWQRAQGAVPDVSAMARVLSDRVASACCVDRDDNWAMYGQEYIKDVQAMLTATPAPEVRQAEQRWSSFDEWLAWELDQGDGTMAAASDAETRLARRLWFCVQRAALAEQVQCEFHGDDSSACEKYSGNAPCDPAPAHPAERQVRGEVQRLREALEEVRNYIGSQPVKTIQWSDGIRSGCRLEDGAMGTLRILGKIDATLAASTGQEVES